VFITEFKDSQSVTEFCGESIRNWSTMLIFCWWFLGKILNGYEWYNYTKTSRNLAYSPTHTQCIHSQILIQSLLSQIWWSFNIAMTSLQYVDCKAITIDDYNLIQHHTTHTHTCMFRIPVFGDIIHVYAHYGMELDQYYSTTNVFSLCTMYHINITNCWCQCMI